MLAILQATAVNGVLAVAATLVIITGGIDLSVGTLMTFCAVIAGVVLTYLRPAAAARHRRRDRWPAPLCGLVSGTIIAKLKIPPFIATLGMMLILKGLSLVISGTKPIYFNDTPGFSQISHRLADRRDLPGAADPERRADPVRWWRSSPPSCSSRTVLGRYTFALGSQRGGRAAVGRQHRSLEDRGLRDGRRHLRRRRPADRLAPQLGAAGARARATSSTPSRPSSSAAPRSSGGRGTVLGTLIGALIMSVLANGLRILSVAQEWQTVVTGSIIILAVYADILRRRSA